MKTQRVTEVIIESAAWREHFALPPAEPETPAPPRAGDEHSRAIALLLVVMALCCGVLIYGIARGY